MSLNQSQRSRLKLAWFAMQEAGESMRKAKRHLTECGSLLLESKAAAVSTELRGLERELRDIASERPAGRLFKEEDGNE